MAQTPAIESDRMVRLFRAFADGEADAAPRFWAHAWPMVRDYASRFLPAADAEDAAQEALAKILQQAPFFDPSRRLVPWMLTIAHFEVLTIRRRRFRRREDAPADIELVAPPPDEVDVTVQAILAAAESLNDVDQQTLLAYLDDERPKSATFRKRLQRALTRLRTAWSLAHPDEDLEDGT